MPCIVTKVNVKITEEKEKVIKEKLGKAIALIPGKSESWLMLSFEDECRLYFKGSKNEGIAFVEIKLFGKASGDAYEKLTAAITGILNEELGISPSQIYVKYEEVSHWGWNGGNF
ncbi:MAG TPA: phenylpyruvate tautomerase MIF-related protein [Caproiciproducens sp.]|nr:phenylpyruvate tautomerase MIF-related protein [Caproiciproducens sp.]